MADPTRPEVDLLADYVEGLLDDEARREVERHMAEDPDTAALVRDLEALPGLLAATPVEPMPADVVARVDAAIARESQDRANTNRANTNRANTNRASALSRRRRWLAPALVAAATVGVVAIAGPVALDGGDSGGGSDSAAESTAEGSSGQTSGEDTTGGVPDTAADPEAPGEGDAPNDEAAPPSITSTDFAPDVEALYAGAVVADVGAVEEAAPDQPRRVTLPARLSLSSSAVRQAPLCYGDVESAFRTAIVFDGEPAYVLVYESAVAGGSQEALAFRCRGNRPTILQRQRIDLP